MATSAQTPSPHAHPDTAHEVLLEFPDNRLLIDLCGEYDRNIAEIEQKLGVPPTNISFICQFNPIFR